jgi:hypothetical protein
MGYSVGFVRSVWCENSAPVEGAAFRDRLNDKVSKNIYISASVVTFPSVNPIPSVISYICLAKE